MKKTYLILIFILSIFSNLFSQTSSSKNTTITLKNGTTINKQVDVIGLTRGYSGKDKVKVCKDNSKDCEKIPISDIDKISIKNNEDGEEYVYEVLYSPKKKFPRMCILVYKGENFAFYIFDNTLASNKYTHARFFVTKADNKIIDFDYPLSSKKQELKSLMEYFGSCSEFSRVANQKKIYKNKDRGYFFKLADKCKNIK